MAETKAERTAAWKKRTTETATALRKAKATYTPGTGKRTIPLSAVTPAQIRVAEWRRQNPIRTIVDVSGKHTRVDTRKLSHRDQARYNMLSSTFSMGQELSRKHKQELVNMQNKLKRMAAKKPTAHQIKLDQQRRDFQTIDRRLSEDKDKYVRTATPDILAPWYFKLSQNTTKSNMLNAINKAYPNANTTGLTDFQIVTLYENVRAGLHKTQPTPTTPAALDIQLSDEVLNFEKWMGDKADDIRGLDIPFGEEGPVKYLREFIAQQAELIGGVPASIEKIISAPEYIPTFIAAGAHGMTVGQVESFKDDPIQTVFNIVATLAAFKAVGKVKGVVTSEISSLRKGKITPSAIIEEAVLSGERRFPVTGKPGVTPDAAINEFIRSEKNIRTAIEMGKVEPPTTAKITGTSQKFLDNVVKTEGEMSAWHATQTGFPKTTTAQVGTSTTPGLHVAPSLSPHFLGVGGEAAVFGFRKGGKPTAISIQVEAFQRIPNTSRKTSATMNQFLLETNEAVGPQGVAFITTKFESLAKKSSVEFEAVLPPGTPITRVGKQLEMKWQGKTITVEQYKTVFSDSIKTDIKNITTLEKLYSERAGRRVLISPYDVLKAEVSGSSMVAKSYRKYSNVFSSSISSSISSIKSAISAATPSYVPYPSPVSRVRPPTSFTSYSSAYSSRAASYIRAIESYISSAPSLIRHVRPVVSAIPVKRRAPTTKKKAKKAMRIEDWFITNPIPTLKSLYGV